MRAWSDVFKHQETFAMKKCLFAASLLAVAVVFGSALSFAADGKELFAKCQGCHGADASKNIKSKAEGDVLKALDGYKAKTYGGDKKAMMENIVKNFSEEDLQALAKYISKL